MTVDRRQGHGDVGRDAHGQDVGVLEDHADKPSELRQGNVVRVRPDRAPLQMQGHLSGRGAAGEALVQAVEDPQQGRLARAGAPQNKGRGAPGDVQVHSGQDIPPGHGDGHVAQREEGGHRRHVASMPARRKRAHPNRAAVKASRVRAAAKPLFRSAALWYWAAR